MKHLMGVIVSFTLLTNCSTHLVVDTKGRSGTFDKSCKIPEMFTKFCKIPESVDKFCKIPESVDKFRRFQEDFDKDV